MGKPLLDLAGLGRWSQGPPFLKQSAEHWPKKPEQATSVSSSELKGITFCCFTAVQSDHSLPDASQFSMWKELVKATQQAHQAQGMALDSGHSRPISHRDAEILLSRGCQAHSFLEEVTALKV